MTPSAWILVAHFLYAGNGIAAIVIDDFPSKAACQQAGETIVKDLGPRKTHATYTCVTRGNGTGSE